MKFSDTSERSKGKLKAENIFFDNKELQETFQQVNRLCCQICSSSVSLINLLDDKYQYTISKCGKWRISKLTRKQSVCNFVVQEGRLLVINDLKDDKRTRNLQFPEDHQIRFYAGIPIRNNSGEILATLCLICYYPKELSEEEQQNFLLLAKHLEVLIDAFENQLQNERNTQVSVEKYIKDKEVWLLEIHHRIKNNLADICGMLQVERSESDDPIIKKILSRTESRIIAALKLHELLYEAHDMVHVNLKE
ncbi:MAG: histidine kinase dimerization/phosphoacceptor domain -containing protein, partial [Balneolaceae bacterium]